LTCKTSRPISLSAPFRLSWRMLAGVHGLAGSTLASGPKRFGNSRQSLSPEWKGGAGGSACPAANARGTTLGSVGSRFESGSCLQGAIAQLDRATDTFLYRLSPQAVAPAGSGSVCLWGRMVSCAPIGNRRKLARVTNPRAGCQPAPHPKLTHYPLVDSQVFCRDANRRGKTGKVNG
jgi:hypothetical protein